MNITGEQIKEQRERRHLTQQELADELGVSLRTVGSWERGESVPRSRMGAIREVLHMETPDDNRAELSRLIKEEMDESRRGPYDVAKGWTSSALRSFYFWRDGDVTPLKKSRPMLEDALGWRRGVVTEILEAPITKTFTLSEVRDWAAMPEPGLVKARDLSNADLGMEVIRRLDGLEKDNERLRAENERLRGGSVVPLGDDQDMYDVAAHGTSAGRNMEHLEAEDED